MTHTRQTKGSTSSKSYPCSPVFTPSATKMQETRNKMPAANVYLLENFVKKAIFFHAFPDWGGLILLRIFTTERVRRMVQRTAKGKNMET